MGDLTLVLILAARATIETTSILWRNNYVTQFRTDQSSI
jgi:hypothetical protein